MRFGSFPASSFFFISSAIGISSLFIVYYLAVSLGHEPPFPKAYISNCARHYPQYIVFRFSTISNCVLMILGWITNHFYLRTVCAEKGFSLKGYYPKVGMIFGIMSAFFLMGSTANIDNGKQDMKWHTNCASLFFIFGVLGLFYNNILYWAIYSKIKTLNKYALYAKTLSSVFLLYCLILGVSSSENWLSWMEQDPLGGDLNKILEWAMAFGVIFGQFFMGFDVMSFKMVYQKEMK